jgi:hypothetical protein
MSAQDELWAKLEALGEDAVRLRLAQGVYGERKKPLVVEWLRRREAGRESQSRINIAEVPSSPAPSATGPATQARTLYERVVGRLKNNPLVVAILLLVVVIGGAATLQDNIRSLYAGLFGGADRTAIGWTELLWSGETLTVEIGDLPDHARGSLLVEGRTYSVRYQQQPCLWESSGPAQQRSGEVVESHFNRAGPGIKPYLALKDSGTATDCNSPRDRKMVVLGLPVDLDRRGYISFGGAEHRIGELQVPSSRWPWPW